jgi:hypothetical protein
MTTGLRRFLPILSLVLSAACGGGGGGADPGGTGSSTDCLLAGQAPPAGRTCCNGMVSNLPTAGDVGICRQPVGGACYSDGNITSIPGGETCCNTASTASYLGSVGSTCLAGGNCTGNASCIVGDACNLTSGFCGGVGRTCLTVGQGTASVNVPCCSGLTASGAGVCYPPVGHLCNSNSDCLSRVCTPSGTVARCS